MSDTIYTIGHSTHSLQHFVGMLQSFDVSLLADIRNYPGSKKFPHFNKEELERAMPQYNIEYRHLKALGGRRKPVPDSKNNAWRSEAFRGYADYAETPAFTEALNGLKEIAKKKRTAFMCSEAVWWRCHRSLVADYLKAEGWTVLHIMSPGVAKEHPYSAPARVVDGKITYGTDELF